MSCTASSVGFVVGMRAEARLLRPLGGRAPVAVGGGTEAGARDAVLRLIRGGVRQLVSLGLAAGLDPRAAPGDVLVPSRVVVDGRDYPTDPSLRAWLGATPGDGEEGGLLHSRAVVATASQKRALHRSSGCDALDMESGMVAQAARRAGLPFAALRAVCDPASRDLPHLARTALRPNGGLSALAMLASLAGRPGQLPALLGLARDAAAARRALIVRISFLQSRATGSGGPWTISNL